MTVPLIHFAIRACRNSRPTIPNYSQNNSGGKREDKLKIPAFNIYGDVHSLRINWATWKLDFTGYLKQLNMKCRFNIQVEKIVKENVNFVKEKYLKIFQLLSFHLTGLDNYKVQMGLIF